MVGGVNVESTTSGRWWRLAIAAYPSMSAMSSAGFPTASMKMSLVFPLIAASTAAKSFTGVNLAVIPAFGRIVSNCENVPPYRFSAATISSPAFAMFVTVKYIAAVPEASVFAAAPPSSAARRFSRTSFVGFISRAYMLPSSLSPKRSAPCLESRKL